MARISGRLLATVDAMPLKDGVRVLEIGGAPGTAAREVARRIRDGHILVIDRSAKGITQTERNAAAEIAAGVMSVRQVAIEDFSLQDGEQLFDIVFANRVGALDGRHPKLHDDAMRRIRAAMSPAGVLFIDGRQVPVE